MISGCVRVRALSVGGGLPGASSRGLCAWNSNDPASYVNWNRVSRSNLYYVLKTYSYMSLALAKTHDYLLLCVSRLCRTLKEDISL